MTSEKLIKDIKFNIIITIVLALIMAYAFIFNVEKLISNIKELVYYFVIAYIILIFDIITDYKIYKNPDYKLNKFEQILKKQLDLFW